MVKAFRDKMGKTNTSVFESQVANHIATHYICKECPKEKPTILAKSGKMTNVARHFERHHKKKYAELIALRIKPKQIQTKLRLSTLNVKNKPALATRSIDHEREVT